MRLNNPFQINDWEIKKFLKVIVTLQFAIWCVIGLDALGFHIPIIRQLIGFIYLTFIPGILILRILKLHKLGNIETLLYTVGLSIATLMFTGLLMNIVYPFFDVSGPFSLTPLIITISLVVLILCVLSYIMDKDFSDPSFVDIKDILSPPALLLYIIPFFSIFGTYLVNYYHSNILLLFLIVILMVIVISIGFDKFIPMKLYPLAVFIISISLLYHRSLISEYLWGWDIHAELFLATLIKNNNIWDPSIYVTSNAMLSVSILPTIYAFVTNMDLIWCFKIIYPLLFSLLPLGLYRVFQKQTDDKIAFLSCFFFISFAVFYGEMLGLAKQEIAELFLLLLILVMINENLDKIKRSILFIVFGFSLVVSHYALSYIYMSCLILAWLMLALLDKNKTTEDLAYSKLDMTISSTIVLSFVVFTLSWYIYLSGSSAFDAIVRVASHITGSISIDFLKPEASEGLRLMTAKTYAPLHYIYKIINYVNQIFIIIGGIVVLLSFMMTAKTYAPLHHRYKIINYVNRIFIIIGGIVVLLRFREFKFERVYVVFAMLNFGLCIAGVIVPYFASSINMTRLYHITLIFLAPFCVIGGITVLRVIHAVARVKWTNESMRNALKVLSIYFVIFSLFATGFVYEVVEGYSGSISLSQEGIKKYGDVVDLSRLYFTYYLDQDICSVKWLSKNRNDELKIYATPPRSTRALRNYGMIDNAVIAEITAHPNPFLFQKAYIYLGYAEVQYGLVGEPRGSEYWNITDITSILSEKCRVYSNGGAEVYCQ